MHGSENQVWEPTGWINPIYGIYGHESYLIISMEKRSVTYDLAVDPGLLPYFQTVTRETFCFMWMGKLIVQPWAIIGI